MIAQIQYYLNQVDSKLSAVAPGTGWFHTGENLAKCKHELQVLSLSLDFVLKHCIIILKSKDKNKLQRIYPLGINAAVSEDVQIMIPIKILFKVAKPENTLNAL